MGHELFVQHPLLGLVYLLFVFVPFLFWPGGWPLRALWPSLLAVATFVPIYLAFYRGQRRHPLLLAGLSAALCYALVPFNPGGNTFLIYALGMLAAVLPARRALLIATALLALLAWQFVLILPRSGLVLSNMAVTVLIGGMVMAGVLLSRERERRNTELRLTQAEVRRLGAMAERERIGRDLHDLLGHTLSLIALKSELAGKLLSRDAAAAAREIDAVHGVARTALAEVREAVSGIRSTGLAAELAAARFALLSADIRLDQRIAALVLPAANEQALALALREAVTNVIRHARARRVEVELRADSEGRVQFSVSDDGCGGIAKIGNGLAGMRERLAAVGGTLGIDSPNEGGTRLRLSVPAALAGA